VSPTMAVVYATNSPEVGGERDRGLTRELAGGEVREVACRPPQHALQSGCAGARTAKADLRVWLRSRQRWLAWVRLAGTTRRTDVQPTNLQDPGDSCTGRRVRQGTSWTRQRVRGAGSKLLGCCGVRRQFGRQRPGGQPRGSTSVARTTSTTASNARVLAARVCGRAAGAASARLRTAIAMRITDADPAYLECILDARGVEVDVVAQAVAQAWATTTPRSFTRCRRTSTLPQRTGCAIVVNFHTRSRASGRRRHGYPVTDVACDQWHSYGRR
jgi:hypothetical protein